MAEAKAAPAAGAQDDQPQDDAPKPEAPKYTQAEMDRITAKVRKNASRDTELRLRREAPPPNDQPALEKKDPPKEDEAPKRDDYPDYESYIDARADWRSKKAAREERELADKERREEEQRQQHAKAAGTWREKIVAAQAKQPDFETVLEDNEETVELIGKAKMREFIAESDVGPLIVYDLCKNPAEAKRIAALPGYKQAAEIAKIEEKLLAEGKPADDEGDPDDKKDEPDTDDAPDDKERNKDGTFKSEKKKDPPPPIEPGTGRPANNSSLPSDKDDAETWRRKELARMAKRQAGK